MTTTYTKLSSARITQLIEQVGMTKREFRTLYWHEDTSSTLSTFDRLPNITIEKLIKLCDILKLSPNEILQYSDKNNISPSIHRDTDIINSPSSNINNERLKTQLEAAQKLISVYEKEIEAKNSQIQNLIALCQQKQDKQTQ